MKKVIISVALVVSTCLAQAACYSEGFRNGEIQKFSVKGLLVKSWEGELALAGGRISGTSAGVSGGNVFRFSVTDPVVADVLQQAAETGQRVSLKYCQDIVNVNFLTQNSKYTVVKATIIKN
jgi:hypothetical protein